MRRAHKEVCQEPDDSEEQASSSSQHEQHEEYSQRQEQQRQQSDSHHEEQAEPNTCHPEFSSGSSQNNQQHVEEPHLTVEDVSDEQSYDTETSSAAEGAPSFGWAMYGNDGDGNESGQTRIIGGFGIPSQDQSGTRQMKFVMILSLRKKKQTITRNLLLTLIN